MWLQLAGRSGLPRVSRRSVSLICGGWVPQDLVFVARPLSKIERRRQTGCSWGCRGLVVRECREARAASSAATVVMFGLGQLVLLCFGGTERACVRGRPPAWTLAEPGAGWGTPGGDLPAKAGELAGDGDRDDPVGLLAGVL